MFTSLVEVVTLADVTEDLWCYDAVRGCYEAAMVFPLSEGEFGVEADATLGDLATAMYILVGGDNSPEDAIAFLSGYGIIPADDANTPLTREQMALYTSYFCYAMGVPVEEVSVEDYADAADLVEGDDGFVGFILENGGLNIGEDNMIYPQRIATRGELCYMIYVLFIAE